MAQQTPAKQLFDLLVSRDFDPEMLDVSGKPAQDPAEAEIFNFDFRAESGKDYGTVVIMLGNDNTFDVYFGDNVGRTMEGADKNDWFAFLQQLKHFAVKNFMSFSPKNINRLRYSMQGQAVIKEGLFESWSGTRTTSWNGVATEARLMIRHKKTIGEGDARYRYVESLFVETAEGERYKLPFTKLAGGRAMLEHVRAGGRPYDARGQHIADIVEELNVLSRFRRANHGRIFEGDTATLVQHADAYYKTAQRTLKTLSTSRGYSTYFESWNPADITEQEVVIEGLKHLFVTQSIDTRIESALPLLARIQQQGTDMKEANIFEAWAKRLMEGTWQLPDTPEKQAALVELLSKDLPVGADATNATEQLYDLLGDDELFDQLEALADRDANADARQVVYDRMDMLSDNPEVRAVIDQLQIDPDATMNPPEATNPSDLEPQDPVQEGAMKELMWRDAERMTREEFVDKYGGEEWVGEFWDNIRGELDETVKDPRSQTEDPAGTKQPAYPEYQDDLASILKAAGVDDTVRAAPDYESEVDEGMTGSVLGAVAGAMTPIPGGAAIGSAVGDTVQDKISDTEETDEYNSSSLQGQYGHSGKMKSVDKDLSFLDRLKELSGMLRTDR